MAAAERGWNFLQWVADNDAWFEQEILALLDDGPPAVLKGRLVLDDRGGVSLVHHQAAGWSWRTTSRCCWARASGSRRSCSGRI